MVERDRLAVSLSAYVDVATTGRLRLTKAVTREALDFDAVLAPAAGGCVLDASLAGRNLAPGRYGISVALGADASERTPTDLRVTLTIDDRRAMVVRSAEDVARPAAARPAPILRRALRKIKRALR